MKFVAHLKHLLERISMQVQITKLEGSIDIFTQTTILYNLTSYTLYYFVAYKLFIIFVKFMKCTCVVM